MRILESLMWVQELAGLQTIIYTKSNLTYEQTKIPNSNDPQ